MASATNHLPLAGSPAARVLIEALDQYVSNQEDFVAYNEIRSAIDREQVENLRVARLLLEKLQTDLCAAVGV